MVQIKDQLKYLVICIFLATLASSARADVNVINTDFFHKISVSNINLTLTDWDKEIKQWVVDWHSIDNGVYELGLYPSTSLPTFTLNSHEVWLFSLDQINWQRLSNTSIQATKIFLKKDEENTVAASEIVVDKDSDLVSISEFTEYQIPENLKLISKVYQIDSQKSDFTIKFHYSTDSDFSKQIFQYDSSLGTWTKLDAYNNVEDKFIKKDFSKITTPIYLAIFEDNVALDGVASFYDQSRYRSFSYKNGLFVASRHYPKGTKLKITRLLTGKSVVVTVNDYGPESRTGRLVDLDKFAFKKIASLGTGLIYVKVEPL